METINLQEYMQGAKDGAVLTLSGDYTVEYRRENRVVVGKSFADNIISIEAKDFVLEGSGATILFEYDAPFETNVNLFYIAQRARNVEFRNLTILVVLRGADSPHTFTVVNNTAYGFKMINCRIEVLSNTRIDLVGVQNTGNADTPLETTADNFQMLGCTVSVCCQSENYNQINRVIGVNNTRANSISIAHNYIMSRNRGNGIKFETVGFYTNGRFGRFVGNNIKANGFHSIGLELEHAYACGFRNEGMYTLISCNNIVGEWGGCCVGLENNGDYADVTGNKILASHTPKGRSIINRADRAIFQSNILTSTSQNCRMFEQRGKQCSIIGNRMEDVGNLNIKETSVGIFCTESAENNLIQNNFISECSDCGIYFEGRNPGRIEGNQIVTEFCQPIYCEIGSASNTMLAERLDERNIRSREE